MDPDGDNGLFETGGSPGEAYVISWLSLIAHIEFEGSKRARAV